MKNKIKIKKLQRTKNFFFYLFLFTEKNHFVKKCFASFFLIDGYINIIEDELIYFVFHIWFLFTKEFIL